MYIIFKIKKIIYSIIWFHAMILDIEKKKKNNFDIYLETYKNL